ncbi:MAG TPA: S8 family serine peptidase [Trebonia sp.]|nr:S8 family serine peptidase [Trebonia sp.]
MINVSRPLRAGLAAAAAIAVVAVATAASALPASAGGPAPAGRTPSAAEWWLPALGAAAAWRAAPAAGAGVTIAVLSTGVDAAHPDLTGVVTTGPDFASTGRRPGQAFWGDEGTAVASLIAGHGHGRGGASGITGIAPGARILSVPVTVEYNDPLAADAAVTGRLPAAIAAGIRYAVAHRATVIALPLDPAEMATAGSGAVDGSRAERAAVAYAVARDVLLVAPAGDDRDGGNAVNYPAAYPGVLAVGATARNGALAPFSNTRSYVALTAPGAVGPSPGPGAAAASVTVGLTVAAPDGGYQTLASTDMSAALTAGVAALIRGRYPWLTAAEVIRAIQGGASAPVSGDGAAAAGRGHGALNAARALTQAAAIAAAHPRPVRQTATPTPTPTPTAVRTAPARHPASTAKAAAPGGAVRAVLLDVLIAACVLIVGLACALAITGIRRRRRSAQAADAARAGRARGPGRHSRAQQPTPPAPLPPPHAAIWPLTPQRPAIGAGSAWATNRPPGGPAKSSGDGREADAPLPPWEQSPTVFASAPVPKAPPPWPLSSSGPMYVWNPAATTGPIGPIEPGEDPEP